MNSNKDTISVIRINRGNYFELSRKLNLWKVRLSVAQENYPARNLYKKMGFCERLKSLFCETKVK